MKSQNTLLTGREVTFDENEIIVSKTDLKGVITYSNTVFQRVAGYTESELIGQPHNIIRHPAMPKAVFKLLWDTIKSGREIFAYVLNRAKNGDEYWVLAHVTPSYDPNHKLIGYHSNRRYPYRDAIDRVKKLYREMLVQEQKFQNSKDAMEASTQILLNVLEQHNMNYDEFIFNLSAHTTMNSVSHQLSGETVKS